MRRNSSASLATQNLVEKERTSLMAKSRSLGSQTLQNLTSLRTPDLLKDSLRLVEITLKLIIHSKKLRIYIIITSLLLCNFKKSFPKKTRKFNAINLDFVFNCIKCEQYLMLILISFLSSFKIFLSIRLILLSLFLTLSFQFFLAKKFFTPLQIFSVNNYFNCFLKFCLFSNMELYFFFFCSSFSLIILLEKFYCLYFNFFWNRVYQ